MDADDTNVPPRGPLAGVRVIEMDALGPVPYCALLLVGMGADVVHVARPKASDPLAGIDITRQGRPSVDVDLKAPDGVAFVRRLAASADIFLEGSRPGAMERLGIGPKDLAAANPRLVYGRMTGWGQNGPLSHTAGHDINYIALSGALSTIGRPGERPVPPLNLVGDYGGGALFLAMGVLAALLEARRSGRGQVVDAAMVDGSASLMTLFYGLAAFGKWSETRGTNFLDGGAPWYDTYETADGRYVAVGAVEEPFWLVLLSGLRINPDELPRRTDKEGWPRIRAELAKAFRSRTRDEWEAHFSATDACVSPVLTLAEAALHPHLVERRTFRMGNGVMQPAPAPRFDYPAPLPETAGNIALADALARWEDAST
ncbi:CaiB/BaiF CoA transferase family protein [Bradyrhizobium macuxiense]|nr:CaiB/BaiF CoA-transferase family protein [Bradyrhizobium macuxiense]